MRITGLLLVGLALAACGETRLTTTSVPTGVGPDAILLRVPRSGGLVRAYRAGRDSVLWTSTGRAPAASALIGFDDFQSVLVARDSAGHALSVDLRLGAVERLGSASLLGPVRAEGGAVFGLDAKGQVSRVAWWRPGAGSRV